MARFILTVAIALFCLAVSARAQSSEKLIRETLQRQTECWNAGDLDCFMDGYWKSDSLLFIGSKGPAYGWQTTLDNYKNSYPDKSAMGKLTFTILQLYPISHDAYYCVGKWELEREMDHPSGHFTLLWRMINGEWVITTDHSS